MITDNLKSILIINEGNSDNIGDQAINESLKFLVVNELNLKYNFEDLSRHKKNNYLRVDLNSFDKDVKILKKPNFLKTWIYRLLWIKKNLGRILNACKNNDYSIIGGGQLLLANNIFPFEVFIWTFFLKIYKIKYSFFSVGTQGNFSKMDLFFLNYSLKNADKIFLRDTLSVNLIKTHFNTESELVYDVAFIYDEILSKNNIPKKNKILVGPVDINVYNNYNPFKKSQLEYHDLWYNQIKDFDLKKVGLFYSTLEDKAQCIKFQEYLGKRINFKPKIHENKNSKEFISNIKSSSLVISGRMHSLILAKTFNIEYKTFLISKKVKEFDRIYKDLSVNTIKKEIKKKFKSIFQN